MTLNLWKISIVFGFLAILSAAFPAEAQSITCANVRCAGSCVDTPEGPVCQPQRQTCASTLCVQGTMCVETSTGPVCRPNTPRPADPPSTGQSCAYGVIWQYGRYVCAAAPRKYWHRKWTPYHQRWHQRRSYYYYPRPTPRPRPEPRPVPEPHPDEQIMCPAVVIPVCA